MTKCTRMKHISKGRSSKEEDRRTESFSVDGRIKIISGIIAIMRKEEREIT